MVELPNQPTKLRNQCELLNKRKQKREVVATGEINKPVLEMIVKTIE